MVAALGAGASAHHSIAAVYDANQPVTVEGVVTQFRFVNPHPYIVISGQEDGGAMQPWHLEMDNRGELVAAGMTAETIRPGDRVVVTGSRSRTVRQNLYIRRLVRPADGFEYEQVGNSPRISQR
jgi:NADPH:quinone reductase-like Zn-dependent oxidoreductase